MTDAIVTQRIQTMLQTIVPALLNASDSWTVETLKTTGSTMFLVKTSNPGPLIGKRGSTIQALRELVVKAGQSGHLQCQFDVMEAT